MKIKAIYPGMSGRPGSAHYVLELNNDEMKTLVWIFEEDQIRSSKDSAVVLFGGRLLDRIGEMQGNLWENL